MELVSCVPVMQNIAIYSSNGKDIWFKGKWLRSQVSDKLFKAKLITTIAKLRNFWQEKRQKTDDFSSTKNANTTSLKSIPSERAVELEPVQKSHMTVERERHEGSGGVEVLKSSFYPCKVFHAVLKDGVQSPYEEKRRCTADKPGP